MKSKFVQFSIWVILLFTVGFFIPQVTLNAQTVTPTPDVPEHPDGPSTPISPEEEQRLRESLGRLDAEIRSYSVLDYPTAYFVSEEAAVEDVLFSAETVVHYGGALVFHTWEAFAEANELVPFEIILVHPSSLEVIDREWAAEAYRSGIIFLGLNVTPYEFGDLFNAPCLQQGDPLPKSIAENWLVSPAYDLRFQESPYREEALKALLEDCIKGYKIAGQLAANFTGPVMPLTESGAENIPHVLSSLIYENKLARQNVGTTK